MAAISIDVSGVVEMSTAPLDNNNEAQSLGFHYRAEAFGAPYQQGSLFLLGRLTDFRNLATAILKKVDAAESGGSCLN